VQYYIAVQYSYAIVLTSAASSGQRKQKMKKAKQTPEQIALQIALLKVLEVAGCSIANADHIMTAAIALDMEPWFVEGAYFDYLDANERIAAKG
jgi:hypothetical protein